MDLSSKETYRFTSIQISLWLFPVAVRSKAYVCGDSPAEIVGSNPTGGIDVFSSFECWVLSDRVLYFGLITRPEESYRVWCV